MAEVIGVIASVGSIVAEGLKLSNAIYTYARRFEAAEEDMKRIAKDIENATVILKQMEDILKQNTKICSEEFYVAFSQNLEDCRVIYSDIQSKVLQKIQSYLDQHTPEALRLTFRDRAKWPFNAALIADFKSSLQQMELGFNLKLNIILYKRAEIDTRVQERENSIKMQINKLEMEILVLKMSAVKAPGNDRQDRTVVVHANESSERSKRPVRGKGQQNETRHSQSRRPEVSRSKAERQKRDIASNGASGNFENLGKPGPSQPRRAFNTNVDVGHTEGQDSDLRNVEIGTPQPHTVGLPRRRSMDDPHVAFHDSEVVIGGPAEGDDARLGINGNAQSIGRGLRSSSPAISDTSKHGQVSSKALVLSDIYKHTIKSNDIPSSKDNGFQKRPAARRTIQILGDRSDDGSDTSQRSEVGTSATSTRFSVRDVIDDRDDNDEVDDHRDEWSPAASKDGSQHGVGSGMTSDHEETLEVENTANGVLGDATLDLQNKSPDDSSAKPSNRTNLQEERGNGSGSEQQVPLYRRLIARLKRTHRKRTPKVDSQAAFSERSDLSLPSTSNIRQPRGQTHTVLPDVPMTGGNEGENGQGAPQPDSQPYPPPQPQMDSRWPAVHFMPPEARITRYLPLECGHFEYRNVSQRINFTHWPTYDHAHIQKPFLELWQFRKYTRAQSEAKSWGHVTRGFVPMGESELLAAMEGFHKRKKPLWLAFSRLTSFQQRQMHLLIQEKHLADREHPLQWTIKALMTEPKRSKPGECRTLQVILEGQINPGPLQPPPIDRSRGPWLPHPPPGPALTRPESYERRRPSFISSPSDSSLSTSRFQNRNMIADEQGTVRMAGPRQNPDNQQLVIPRDGGKSYSERRIEFHPHQSHHEDGDMIVATSATDTMSPLNAGFAAGKKSKARKFAHSTEESRPSLSYHVLPKQKAEGEVDDLLRRWVSPLDSA